MRSGREQRSDRHSGCRGRGRCVIGDARVLTGARSVRPESAAAVHAAVAQLNYRPNQLGRALRRQSTQVIGMVVPSIDNPFFPSVIQTVERNLRARGYALLLSTSEDDPRVEAERVEMLVDRQVDGLLISPCRRTESRAAVVDAAARVPLVQLDRAIDGRALDFVGVDDAQGIRSIVDLVTAIAPDESRISAATWPTGRATNGMPSSWRWPANAAATSRPSSGSASSPRPGVTPRRSNSCPASDLRTPSSAATISSPSGWSRPARSSG